MRNRAFRPWAEVVFPHVIHFVRVQWLLGQDEVQLLLGLIGLGYCCLQDIDVVPLGVPSQMFESIYLNDVIWELDDIRLDMAGYLRRRATCPDLRQLNGRISSLSDGLCWCPFVFLTQFCVMLQKLALSVIDGLKGTKINIWACWHSDIGIMP